MSSITTIGTVAYKAEALTWLARRLDWEDRLSRLRECRGEEVTECAEAVRAVARTA
jgi:hypothetical protein